MLYWLIKDVKTIFGQYRYDDMNGQNHERYINKYCQIKIDNKSGE
jgi:hypothetical protein